MGIVADVVGLRRKRRRRQLAPRAGPVAPPEFGAEMAKIERGVDGVPIRQHRGYRIAQELRVDDFPRPVAAHELEQTLAGPDMNAI